MDFLTQTFTQLKTRFLSMAPGTRVATGLLLAAVVAGAACLVAFPRQGDQVYLFNGESVAAENLPDMESAFAQKNLNSYNVVGNRIRVPRKQLDAYLNALHEAKALPRKFGQDFDEALEKTPMFASSRTQKRLDQLAKQKELVRTLCSWNFISNAAVFIDTEQPSGFREKRIVTASISVTPRGSKRLDANQVASIRQFITGAVAGLKPENVAITDCSGRTFPGTAPAAESKQGNQYVALTKTCEREWKAKILDALSYIPGVVVTTNVVLNRPSNRPQIDRPPVAAQYDSTPACRPQSLHSSWQQKNGHQAGGTPDTPEAETGSYVPARISVSVAVPNSYFTKVWQRHKSRTSVTLEKVRAEETAKIRSQVANLLPLVKGQGDSTGSVNVSTFPDFPPEAVAASNSGKETVARGKYLPALGVLAMALFGLAVSWWVIHARRTTRKGDDDPGILSMETGGSEELLNSRPPHKTEPSTHDKLRRLVREDPAAAASVLDSWIRKAG